VASVGFARASCRSAEARFPKPRTLEVLDEPLLWSHGTLDSPIDPNWLPDYGARRVPCSTRQQSPKIWGSATSSVSTFLGKRTCPAMSGFGVREAPAQREIFCPRFVLADLAVTFVEHEPLFTRRKGWHSSCSWGLRARPFESDSVVRKLVGLLARKERNFPMNLKLKNLVLALSMVAGGSAVATRSLPAQAGDGEICSVTQVAWEDGFGGNLQIFCSGAARYAFGWAPSGSPACPVASMDTRKAWLSLAQSALLSGKKLSINTSTCSGGPGISYIRLLQ